MARTELSRRHWLRLASLGVGLPLSGWLAPLANAAASDPGRKRSCILLWMNGGPSTIDLWDLKPGHANGGPFREIKTNVPGVRIGEHLPNVAKHADKIAIIRSMSTKEGDHGRGTQLMHTGYLQPGPINYPSIGALLAKELGDEAAELPGFVGVGTSRVFSPAATGAGFLGPKYAPLVLGGIGFRPEDNDPGRALKVPDLNPAGDVTKDQADARIGLLKEMAGEFGASHGGGTVRSRASAYERAVRLMRGGAARAFDLSEEPAKLRDRYGRNLFGQGCLLARRLVERGVPFVEVAMTQASGAQIGWDTHVQNFDAVKSLCGVLDPAFATLLDDLKAKGLLETTTVVWMGEFGRTPRINGQNGRDHHPNAWATVLAGGGIGGGQAYGQTSPDGTNVEDKKVSTPDFLATVVKALGIDPGKKLISNVGRPVPIVDQGARVVTDLLA